MRLINIEPEAFGIKQNVRIQATAVGSKGPGQMMFLVPVRGGERECNEDLWEVMPTTSGKPQLVANAAKDPGGAILRVSTYNRSGKRIGRILVRERDLGNVTCIGFGVAGTEDGVVTWEEAIFRIHGPCAVFYLVNVGPPNEFLVYVEGEEVKRYPATPESPELTEDDYIRVDDPRVHRWKAPEEHGNVEEES